MSDFLHKLRVIIEGDSSSLNKESKKAVDIAKKAVNDINSTVKNVGQIKNVVDEKSTISQIRNTNNMIKKSFSDALSGKLMKGLAGEVKNYAKEAQLAAGVKVYSDEYKLLCSDIEKTESQLSKLTSSKEKMEASGKSKTVSQEFKDLEKNIASTQSKLEKLFESESKMKAIGKDIAPTQEFKDLQKNIVSTQSKLNKLLDSKNRMETSGKATVPTTEYKEVEAQMAEVQKRLDGLIAQQMEWRDLGIRTNDPSMKALSADIQEAETELAFLKGELSDMNESGTGMQPTKEFEKLLADIQNTEMELLTLEESLSKLNESGTATEPTKEFKYLQSEIEVAKHKLEEYKAERDRMIADGSNLTESEAFKNLSNNITQAERNLQSYNTQRSNMESSGGDVEFAAGAKTSALANIGYTAQGTVAVVKQIGTAFGEVIGQIPVVGRLAKTAFSMTKTAAGVATTAIKKSGGAFAALIQKFVSGIPIIGRLAGTQKSSGNSFKSGLKTVLKYAFGIRSLYVLFNKLRSAMKEGFSNLANYSSPAGSAINSLQASLTTLKNSFAAAFAPILTYVAPALETLINWVVAAANAIGRLLSALTGKSYAVQAVKVSNSAASSMGSAADAANDAADAVDNYKRSLLGFDQINKLDDNDSDSSSGSGGSGGGGGSGSGGGVGFTTTEVDSATSGLANAIKEAWANSDFTEIGEMVGTKLKEALDDIPWDGIKESCRKVAKCVGTFINGFFETEGLAESVGKTLAEVLNTGVTTLNTLIKTIHWDSVGKFITTGLQTALQTFDFSELGNTASSSISAALDLGTGLLEGVDFKQLPKDLAKAVKDAITGFDFASVFESAGKLVGTALVSAIDLVSGVADLVGDFVKSVKEYFASYGVKWDSDANLLANGKNIVLGLYNGIKDAISSIGTWIKENIFDPFIKGFKSAFGINSPSTVMKEQAGYLIDGLLEGLKGGIDSIITWFKDLPGKIKEVLGGAGLAIEAAVSLVKSGWTTLAAFVGDKISAALALVKSGWTTITSFVGDIGSKAFKLGKDGWSSISDYVGNISKRTFKLGKDGWSSITSFVGDISKRTFALGKDGWSSITSYVGGISQRTFRLGKNGWSSITSYVGNISARLVKLKKSGWTSLSSWVGKTVTVGVKLFKSGWKSIKSFFGLSTGGTVAANGGVKLFSSGGVISRKGVTSWWNSIPKYASGGDPTHGTMFVAGEAGAEIVGNVNGRTEVLNKSQIASAIYSAVSSAMSQSMSGFLSKFSNMKFEMRFADMSKSSFTESYAFSGSSNSVSGDRLEAAFYSALMRFASENTDDRSININVTISPDSKGLFRIVKTEADNYTSSTGKPAFAY